MSLSRRCGSRTRNLPFLASFVEPGLVHDVDAVVLPRHIFRAARADAVHQPRNPRRSWRPMRPVRPVLDIGHPLLQRARGVLDEQLRRHARHVEVASAEMRLYCMVVPSRSRTRSVCPNCKPAGGVLPMLQLHAAMFRRGRTRNGARVAAFAQSGSTSNRPRLMLRAWRLKDADPAKRHYRDGARGSGNHCRDGSDGEGHRRRSRRARAAEYGHQGDGICAEAGRQATAAAQTAYSTGNDVLDLVEGFTRENVWGSLLIAARRYGPRLPDQKQPLTGS